MYSHRQQAREMQVGQLEKSHFVNVLQNVLSVAFDVSATLTLALTIQIHNEHKLVS